VTSASGGEDSFAAAFKVQSAQLQPSQSGRDLHQDSSFLPDSRHVHPVTASNAIRRRQRVVDRPVWRDT